MAKEIKIPQIAEGVESATVTEILVSEGDNIEKDQSLITVESDKASVEIPSPESGRVKSISVSEGDEVKVEDVILSLEASGSDEKEENEDNSEDKKSEEPKNDDSDNEDETTDENEEKEKEEVKKAKKKRYESSKKDKDETDEEEEEEDEDKDEDDADENVEDEEEGKKKEKSDASKNKENTSEENKKQKDKKVEAPAAPGVRRLARELGINIDNVEGSGEGGRIAKDDIKAHAKKGKAETNNKKSPSLPDFSKWGEIETKPFSGIRSATAKNTASSWRTIPHVFQFDEAEISGIQKYIEKNKEKAEEAGGKLTITAILVKISAGALDQFPKFNASIDIENQEMILKKYVNIGIAVDTEKGLLVPVIKNADKKSIIEISAEITQLAEKARSVKLTPDEMHGGNFTISNLGGIGGTNFTPIVLHPQVAILGVSRASKKPVYVDGKFEPRDVLPLSLSYDHRLIDGAEGVHFLDWIARALEDPYSALLGA